mmetsp:Transcript_48604/g.127008  ORF Transcript_48604/g.127008 Transcript_48604/m.127008 type:complete len:663 (-) Transcript_48604:239-2227(-)
MAHAIWQARVILAILAVAGPAHGWVTSSQSLYGAQIEQVKDMMEGQVTGRTPIAELGWLWHYPTSNDDNRGLGGGITWAWDSALCSKLEPRFREDIIGGDLVGCNEMKAAIARAFDKWGANSRFLHFLDVTKECENAGLNYGPPGSESQIEQPHGGCPLAEIWVTYLSSSVSRRRLDNLLPEGVPADFMGERWVGEEDARRLSESGGTTIQAQEGGAVAVATALPHARYVSDFRYTNGKKAFYTVWGNEVYNRSVVETYAGTFSFNVDTVCWYLDSAFCAPFHKLKKSLGSPENARMLVWGLTYGLTALGILFYLGIFCNMALRTLQLGGYNEEDEDLPNEDDEDGDGQLSCKERFNAVIRVLSHWNPFVLTIFLLLLILPPLVTTRIFAPCFDCYDFEAAALHEIGHFLGLGHPDNIPDNWQVPANGASITDALPTPGNNSYQENIASAMLSGHRPNVSEICMNPWAGVRPGVPLGAEIDMDKLGARYPTRDAQMEARTQHNPRTCLTNDDLEALAVIYPDCDDHAAMFAAVCHEVNLNIGIVRLAVWILIPSIIALFVVITLSSIVHAFERREKARLMATYEVERQNMQSEAEAQRARHKLQLAVAKLGNKKIAKTPGKQGKSSSQGRSPGKTRSWGFKKSTSKLEGNVAQASAAATDGV